MTYRISRAAVVAAVLASLAASQIAAAKTVYSDASRARASTDAGDKTHGSHDDVIERFNTDDGTAPKIGSSERLSVVFGSTNPDPTARAFNGVYVQNTFEAGPQPVNLRVLHDLDELLFDNAIVGLASDDLQLSGTQGIDGVFNAQSGTGGGAGAAVALPGFNSADNTSFAGGRGPSATTAVPEPATGLLLLAGGSALLAARRRRSATR